MLLSMSYNASFSVVSGCMCSIVCCLVNLRFYCETDSDEESLEIIDSKPLCSSFLENCNFTLMVFCAAVRYGRVPKRSLSADDQPVSTTESLEMQPGGSAESTATALSAADDSQSMGNETEEDIAAFENRQLAVFDVILSVAHSHTVHCDTTEDKVAALAKKPASLVLAFIVCPKTENLVSCQQDAVHTGVEAPQCLHYENN